MIAGVAMGEDEWRRHPDVVAANKNADPNGLPPAAPST